MQELYDESTRLGRPPSSCASRSACHTAGPKAGSVRGRGRGRGSLLMAPSHPDEVWSWAGFSLGS